MSREKGRASADDVRVRLLGEAVIGELHLSGGLRAIQSPVSSLQASAAIQSPVPPSRETAARKIGWCVTLLLRTAV